MKGRIGRGREPGDQRGQRQHHQLAPAPQRDPRGGRIVGRGKQPGHADLHQRDQPEGGRKRHLETRMHQRLRRDREHDHRGDRQRAESDGAAVDHDRDQNYGRHEERTLRRHLGAGQQKVERGGDKRCRR